MDRFVVYECEIFLRQGTKITRMKRYNDFVDLRDTLKSTYPKLRYGGTLPKLPPKNNLCKQYLARNASKYQLNRLLLSQIRLEVLER
jgi:hypothetical protein